MCSSCNCKKDAEELMDEPLVSLYEEHDDYQNEEYVYSQNTGGDES